MRGVDQTLTTISQDFGLTQKGNGPLTGYPTVDKEIYWERNKLTKVDISVKVCLWKIH